MEELPQNHINDKKINKTTNGEKLTQKLFCERFDLNLEKIPESKKQTPDFFLKKNDKKIAVIEVKDLEDITPTTKNPVGYKKDNFGLWFKDDNSASRISKRINEAHTQLKNNFHLPKIIVLVNYSLSLDVLDLHATLDGYLIYVSKEGARIKNLSPYNKISPIVRKKFKDIDLYFWIETNNQKIKKFGYDIICFPNDQSILRKILENE